MVEWQDHGRIGVEVMMSSHTSYSIPPLVTYKDTDRGQFRNKTGWVKVNYLGPRHEGEEGE